jgi:hypothetical protein
VSTNSALTLVPPGSTIVPIPVGPTAFDAGFDTRWNAWRARGEAQERSFKARLWWVVGGVAGIALGLGYLLIR